MTDKNEFIERMENYDFRNQHKSGKLPVFKRILDEQGRSYEDNYYVKCLNCGRCRIVGKCCGNRITQNMIDKSIEEK